VTDPSKPLTTEDTEVTEESLRTAATLLPENQPLVVSKPKGKTEEPQPLMAQKRAKKSFSKKNSVCGRYLATFSSNCFAISGNQVAELVAAAILVATSGHLLGHLKHGCRIHAVDFCSAFSLSCFQRVARADAGWIRHTSRMDTTVSVFVSCKPRGPANLS